MILTILHTALQFHTPRYLLEPISDHSLFPSFSQSFAVSIILGEFTVSIPSARMVFFLIHVAAQISSELSSSYPLQGSLLTK